MSTFSLIAQLHLSIKEARTSSGRNIAVACEAGQFQVNEITAIHKNGGCDITHLTEMGSMEDAVAFLNTITANNK